MINKEVLVPSVEQSRNEECNPNGALMDNVVVEELTLRPIGESKELGFKPLRITIDGKTAPLIFNARDISEIKRQIAALDLSAPSSPEDGRASRHR